jgi:hypothetical protein
MAGKRYKKIKTGILDTQTGLIWEKTQNKNKMTWEEAMEYASSLGPGWRLPSIGELFSIVHHDVHDPASDLPEIVSSHYWSSTTYASSTSYAWSVYFYDGLINSNDKTSPYYVRCVCTGLK